MTATEIKLSPDQQVALDHVLDFWQKGGSTLTLGGYAGTGKSFVVAETVRALRGRGKRKWRHRNAEMAFCAFTGKAADVLRRKLAAANALEPEDYCGTIHGLIYEPKFLDGKIVGWRKKDSLDYDLIVVDEASMVNSDLHADLTSYRVPILYVGDHGQLPPIEGELNLMAEPEIRLEKIHRQAQGNPIIKLSMMAREDGRIPVGVYGEYVRKVDDLKVIERIADPNKAMILCGWNAFRRDMNVKVRGIAGIVNPRPVTGDRVICLRNNKNSRLFNGMTGEVVSIEEFTDDAYRAEIEMDGSGRFSGFISTHQFGQEKTMAKIPGWTKEDPIEAFDFGYAMTVHKAQGSEHGRVVLFEQRFASMDDDAWRRWLYTGVSRATERLLVVGF
jgi:exodeoxyribonuclease-5